MRTRGGRHLAVALLIAAGGGASALGVRVDEAAAQRKAVSQSVERLERAGVAVQRSRPGVKASSKRAGDVRAKRRGRRLPRRRRR